MSPKQIARNMEHVKKLRQRRSRFRGGGVMFRDTLALIALLAFGACLLVVLAILSVRVPA